MCNISKQSGITLMELMVVVAIISILGAIAVPLFVGNVEESRVAECRNEVAAIRLAEEEFFLTNNNYVSGTLDGPNNVTTLVANLAGIYIPSNVAAGVNSNCMYTVVAAGLAGPGGPQYTITATGVNQLAGRGVVVNIVGP